ncbi:MAG: methyl-accepting chemotaxis protein [Clostridia bacterium]|jgi:methyl-accepting chemotaxis protein|nr:methyl-accepting chemotaxis protein [Clostridia bacterium]
MLSIRAKINILLVAIIIISAIIGGSVFQYIETQKEYNRYINLAGKQRALSQKMAKEVLIYRAGNKKILTDLLKTQEMFEKTLLGFLNGDNEQNLKPVNNVDLKNKLNNLLDQWNNHKNYLEKAISTKVLSLEELNQYSMELFNTANDVTITFEKVAKEKAALPLRILIGSITLIFLFSLMGGIALDRQALKPLSQLTKITTELAKGNLAVKNFKFDSKDEIGTLVKSVNEMQQNFKQMITQITNAAQQVTSSSQQLAASSDKVEQYAQNIGSATEEVAAGAEEQTSQITDTAHNIENLIEEIANVSSKSKEMQQVGTKTINIVSEGTNYVHQSVQQMHDIENKVQNSSHVIRFLGEKSSKVGEIVNIISGIAEQTNLLALNAAIEAARAGEQGRGFAVVAEEVRKLAEESAQATQQISELIKEIQNSISDAVGTIEESTSEVQKGVLSIESTGQSFAKIKTNIENLLQHIAKVNENAQQMAIDSDKVKTAIQEIASVSEEFAASTEEVASSSEEQVKSINEITTSAHQLAQLADELSKSVAKFEI